MAIQNRFQAAGANDIPTLRRATNNAFSDLSRQITNGLNSIEVSGDFLTEAVADGRYEPIISTTITLDGGVTITSAGEGETATVTFAINGRNEMQLSSTGLTVRGEITGNNGDIT